MVIEGGDGGAGGFASAVGTATTEATNAADAPSSHRVLPDNFFAPFERCVPGLIRRDPSFLGGVGPPGRAFTRPPPDEQGHPPPTGGCVVQQTPNTGRCKLVGARPERVPGAAHADCQAYEAAADAAAAERRAVADVDRSVCARRRHCGCARPPRRTGGRRGGGRRG